MKMDDNEFKTLYENYKQSKFRQQKMDGWRPMPTISCVTIIFVSIGVFFILMGIIMLILIAQIYEIKKRYDDECYFVGSGNKCYIELSIKKNMKGPIWIFYQIDGITQNFTNPENFKVKQNNTQINKPFDDFFTDWKISGKDKNDYSYENYTYDYSNIIPFPNPRIFWGKLEIDKIDSSSKISLNILIGKYNNTLGIKKYIIVSEISAFGGKSFVLGIFYLLFGLLCLIASIIFINAFNNFHKRI